MKTKASSKKTHQQVFLSYASADRQAAQQIARELVRAGARVWFDQWELKAGDPVADRVEEALSTSDLLVVLLSPHAIKSRWVQLELNAALSRELSNRGVTLIPAMIENCKIPPFLANRQFIDFRSDFKGALRQLIREVGVASEIDFARLNGRSFEGLVGDLLAVCSRRLPNTAAHIKRNTIFSQEGKVILFLTVGHLKEMLLIKKRGEDPSDLIMDMLESFYLQHE